MLSEVNGIDAPVWGEIVVGGVLGLRGTLDKYRLGTALFSASSCQNIV